MIWLPSCYDETDHFVTAESNRIGFEICKEWHYAERDSTRSGINPERRMIESVSMKGELPEDQDSIFLQVIEDNMHEEKTETADTRSILRS